MYPFLFRHGDLAIQSYLILSGLGFFAALMLLLHEAEARHWAKDKIIHLSLLSFLWGWVGAKLLFFVLHPERLWAPDFNLWRFLDGGVVFMGGALGGFLYLMWALPRWGLKRRAFLDAAAPALTLGHFFGRIGCFLNGCCNGDRCDLPWAVTYTDLSSAAQPLGVPLHPVQIYEAMGLLLLTGVLYGNNQRQRKSFPGARVYSADLYLFLYGILRFLMEFFRGDTGRPYWGPLSVNQILSLVLVFVALLLDLKRRSDNKNGHESRN